MTKMIGVTRFIMVTRMSRMTVVTRLNRVTWITRVTRVTWVTTGSPSALCVGSGLKGHLVGIY